ncbi:hypothetical protein LCGC14_2788640, partial [marine sediment metagenome]
GEILSSLHYAVAASRISNIKYDWQHEAEALSDRLAPLIRGEFPTNEHLDILGDILASRIHVGEAIKRLKSLWESQPEGDDILDQEGTIQNILRMRNKRLANHKPTLREFPDEALKNLLDLIPGKETLFWKIKCLLEGPDHIAEVRKKVCQTCGGSGERRTGMATYPQSPGNCPDCKGTGEEKKKYCLRCGVVCSESSVVSCHRNAGEKIGKHRWTDERSGSDRRELRHIK